MTNIYVSEKWVKIISTKTIKTNLPILNNFVRSMLSAIKFTKLHWICYIIYIYIWVPHIIGQTNE
jgi:hypothetical protein